LVADNLADPNRAELDRLYRQWRDRENGPVESDLYTAIWIFATKYAGDDLGHDVCLRVVRELNRLQARRPAALPEEISAYLYGSCRNARKDQRRQTRKYVPLLEQHIPQVSSSHDFGECQGDYENTTDRRLANFEKCRTSLPAAIAQLLDLADFDLLAALDTTGRGSEAVKKRMQRARSKCLLAFGAAAVIGYPTPQPLSMLISRLSPSLRGGPWEKVLAIAPRFRDLNPDGCRASATTLVEAAQHRLATFVGGGEGVEAFKDSYTWFRTAALLSPEVVSDAYGELKSDFLYYKGDYPLTGRLLDRICALRGNDAAAAEGNQFWHHCLATLREEAEYVGPSEAFFGAAYVIAYYAEPRLSRPLFHLLHPFDRGRIEQFLKEHSVELRDSIIEQACANVAEQMYQAGPHAETNFVRVQLGLSCLSRCSPRLGRGYARLSPETAMELAIIAEHAARTAVDNCQLRRMAEKIRGSLIDAYDLKWREFSRRCERALSSGRR
jgi:DNA-directed RNA polymerase specialized sigma24 family protein